MTHTMTNEQLAAALGVSERTIPRLRKKGLPIPMEGEDPKAWALRAEHWRKQNRRPPGRPRDKEQTPDQADAEARFRLARAIKVELEVAVIKGELHSRKQCEAEHTRRVGEMTIAMLGIGQSVARRCYNRTPDVIQQLIDEEVRRRLLVLSDGGMPDDDPAAAAAAASEAPEAEQPDAGDAGGLPAT